MTYNVFYEAAYIYPSPEHVAAAQSLAYHSKHKGLRAVMVEAWRKCAALPAMRITLADDNGKPLPIYHAAFYGWRYSTATRLRKLVARRGLRITEERSRNDELSWYFTIARNNGSTLKVRLSNHPQSVRGQEARYKMAENGWRDAEISLVFPRAEHEKENTWNDLCATLV